MLLIASSMLDPIWAVNGACIIHVSAFYFGPLNSRSSNSNPDKNMEPTKRKSTIYTTSSFLFSRNNPCRYNASSVSWKEKKASINFALWQSEWSQWSGRKQNMKCSSKSHTDVTPQSTAVRGNILISTGSNSCSTNVYIFFLLQEAQHYYIFIILMQHSNKTNLKVHWNSYVFMTLLTGNRLYCVVTIPHFLSY